MDLITKRTSHSVGCLLQYVLRFNPGGNLAAKHPSRPSKSVLHGLKTSCRNIFSWINWGKLVHFESFHVRNITQKLVNSLLTEHVWLVVFNPLKKCVASTHPKQGWMRENSLNPLTICINCFMLKYQDPTSQKNNSDGNHVITIACRYCKPSSIEPPDRISSYHKVFKEVTSSQ